MNQKIYHHDEAPCNGNHPGTGQTHQFTSIVHAGGKRNKLSHSLVEPIFQTATYTFDDMADACEYQAAHNQGHAGDRCEYGRYQNPTVFATEARLAALEKAESSVLVSSGMAAFSSIFLHFLSSGDHVILTDDSYRRTRQFCEENLNRFGVSTTVVPLGDFAALEEAIQPETKIIFSETPSNPYLKILDLEKIADIGKRYGILTVIDATIATPVNLKPLDWGVDLVFHSATKYLGGHHDLLAGVISGRAGLVDKIRETIGIVGAIIDPQTAFLLDRGLKTLAVRVTHQNQSAQKVAEFLKSHPKIEQVWYPGLLSHPGHEIAIRQMAGFGGLLSFTVKGDRQKTFEFMDSLSIPFISPSFGGIESLVLHPAAMAYSDLSAEECSKLGIPQNLVRYAVGLEDCTDLISDLDQALQKI